MLSRRDVYGDITMHKEYYTPADRVNTRQASVVTCPNAHSPHVHKDVHSRVQGPNAEQKLTATHTGKKIVPGGQNDFVQNPDIIQTNRKHRAPKPVKNSERPPWYPLRKNDRIGKQDLAMVGPGRKASKQIELQCGQDALLLSSLRVEPGNTTKRPGRGRKLPKPPTENPQDLPAVFQRLTNPKYYTASHKYRFMAEEEEPDLADQGVPSKGNATWWKKDTEPTGPEDLPNVYQRLTNPKYFTSTHKHRFTKDGVGRGIDGRRDDETLQTAIGGGAKITRETDLEMDAPSMPTKSYIEQPAPKPRGKRPVSSQDAYTDKVMTEGVFSRLYKPAYTDRRAEGEHDAKIKTLKQFNVVKEVIPRWQSGL